MTTAGTTATATTASFPCPNEACSQVLQSPHHTICPVCAEPISPDYIRSKVGDVLFRKAWRVPGGDSKLNPVAIGVIVAILAIGIIALIIATASGG